MTECAICESDWGEWKNIGGEYLPVCPFCVRELEERVRYDRKIVVQKCPTCKDIKSAYVREYQEDDPEALECQDCHRILHEAVILERYGRNLCLDCLDKNEFNDDIQGIPGVKDCPECGRFLKSVEKKNIRGKVFRHYDCWYCDYREKVLVREEKPTPPSGVRPLAC